MHVCRNGHKLTKPNLYYSKQAGRSKPRVECKQCKLAYFRKRYVAHPRPKPTHCPNGHEYTPLNMGHFLVDGKLRTYCRVCHRGRSRRYAERKKAGHETC